LATRQLVTRGPQAFELVWTFFGYAEDSEEMTRIRLRQANLMGPAGLVSIDDSEMMQLSQHGVGPSPDAVGIVELGGHVTLDDPGLGLLAVGELASAGLAELLRGLEPALALAAQHRELVGSAVLGVLLQLGQHQSQGTDALLVAGLHRAGHVGANLIDEAHTFRIALRFPATGNESRPPAAPSMRRR